jgi:hypothetical protein
VKKHDHFKCYLVDCLLMGSESLTYGVITVVVAVYYSFIFLSSFFFLLPFFVTTLCEYHF